MEVISYRRPRRHRRKRCDIVKVEKNLRRCGECENCCRENCGKCNHCLDMPKFGGKYLLKKSCVHRICVMKLAAKRDPIVNEIQKAEKFRRLHSRLVVVEKGRASSFRYTSGERSHSGKRLFVLFDREVKEDFYSKFLNYRKADTHDPLNIDDFLHKYLEENPIEGLVSTNSCQECPASNKCGNCLLSTALKEIQDLCGSEPLGAGESTGSSAPQQIAISHQNTSPVPEQNVPTSQTFSSETQATSEITTASLIRNSDKSQDEPHSFHQASTTESQSFHLSSATVTSAQPSPAIAQPGQPPPPTLLHPRASGSYQPLHPLSHLLPAAISAPTVFHDAGDYPLFTVETVLSDSGDGGDNNLSTRPRLLIQAAPANNLAPLRDPTVLLEDTNPTNFLTTSFPPSSVTASYSCLDIYSADREDSVNPDVSIGRKAAIDLYLPPSCDESLDLTDLLSVGYKNADEEVGFGMEDLEATDGLGGGPEDANVVDSQLADLIREEVVGLDFPH